MRVKDSFFLVYGHEFLLSYAGAEATQKGRFYSEFTYFPSNFLYLCAGGGTANNRALLCGEFSHLWVMGFSGRMDLMKG